MPSDITTPAPAAAIDRLTLATDSIRGTEASSEIHDGCFSCICFVDDAE